MRDLGFDPMSERERVYGRFFGAQRDLRTRHLVAGPERARREIAIFEGPDLDGTTFSSRTERELRQRACFTEAECERVGRWGSNGPVDRRVRAGGGALRGVGTRRGPARA